MQTRSKVIKAIAAPEQWANQMLLCESILGSIPLIGNPVLECYLALSMRKLSKGVWIVAFAKIALESAFDVLDIRMQTQT